MDLRFDRFYRHEELIALLEGFAARAPRLFRVETIGRSHEGRDIVVVAATNADTGPADLRFDVQSRRECPRRRLVQNLPEIRREMR